MDREGGNTERMRECREWISLLILSQFPLHFLIHSPVSHSQAARLAKLVQPCFCLMDQSKKKAKIAHTESTHTKIAQRQYFKICVNKAWIINTKCVMSLLRLTQPPIKYANLQNLQNAKKHGFRIHWQKINTASPKNSIDGVWALFQHCDWQWYLDINKNDLKQDKISNANSAIIFLINLLMVRVIAHLVR